ncbi:MAG: hypothetical protein H0V30_04670 [Chitinophagaceae bacterium]|nr:hypothetical protein [Chitinophagaceae bacterium]
MKKIIILFSIHLILLCTSANAQRFQKLTPFTSETIQVYHSAGQENRAKQIIPRVEKAMAYHQQLVDFKPEVIVLILTKADWSSYTNFPVYGMPHYSDDKTLIVAAEDNVFWQSFLPPLEQLPADLRKKVEQAYSMPDGRISMQPFFDLLALHELGHAFHFQGGLQMQRKWMGELFCNILLHAYVAENEPEQLAALTVFPNMVIGNGTSEYQFTSLRDIEERYEEIGMQHAKNYGWFQSRWHAAAKDIYDAAGEKIIPKLWTAFKNQQEKLNDEALIMYLESAVHKSLADVMRNWGD